MRQLIKALGRDLTPDELKAIKSNKIESPYIAIAMGYAQEIVVPSSVLPHIEAILSSALYRESKQYNHHWLVPFNGQGNLFRMEILSADQVALELGYAALNITESPE